ncbi:MAG: GNAT family N-acetyltransferase, partial [Acidimicrobiales bacterium]
MASLQSGESVEAETAPAPPPPALPLPWPPLLAPECGVGLRPWGAAGGDARSLAAAWADPEVARWNRVPADHGEAAAAAWIAGEAERRDRGLAVDLVVTEPGQPDGVLGEVGFAMVDQERRWGEVGYWITAPARGRGMASGALTMFSHWVLGDLPVARLIARTSQANP